MANWSAGYVVDVEYTHGFYQELTPSLLSFLALLQGVQTPDLGSSLSYCELGCGQGFSTNLLAAANPHIQFHATDFNPGHIVGAQSLAQAGGLQNVHFYDDSFADFLILQPGFTSASGALAPVAFASALLMAPAPHRPVLHGLKRWRPLPHQMPKQPAHLRYGERQQPCGLPCGGFSPRWRAGARW